MQRKSEYLLFRWLSPHHFILLTSIWLSLGCILAYIISVQTGHVSALFPYISDAGAEPPASCVFGFFLNISAVFTFISMYIRHGDIERVVNLPGDERLLLVNDVSMFVGCLACLGATLVACFQTTAVFKVHMVGAGMLFVLGIIYCYMQSYISYKSIVRTSALKTTFRLIISMTATLFFIFTVIFGYIASSKSGHGIKDKLHWSADEPGFYAHVISAFSEWIMAACLIIFFQTFYSDFKNIKSKFEVKSKVDWDLVGSTNDIST